MGAREATSCPVPWFSGAGWAYGGLPVPVVAIHSTFFLVRSPKWRLGCPVQWREPIRVAPDPPERSRCQQRPKDGPAGSAKRSGRDSFVFFKMFA